MSPPAELSIVVGTYNRLDQLRMCIESIVRETRASFVLHVTDAGSTDGTVEFLRERASERIRPHLVGRRLGQARAYNEIFAQVDTPYVCWLSDDNIVVLRLAEMYLIRAEANARLGADAATVRADINVVRNRAGLPDLPADVDTQQELLDAILLERRFEFAMEGHRFFDLRRFGVATTVLGIAPERLLFPIPQAEMDVNDQLEQNPGY